MPTATSEVTSSVVLADDDRRLLRLVASGLHRGAVAAALGWPPEVVHERMRQVRRVLDARTDIHAVVVALRRGVIE